MHFDGATGGIQVSAEVTGGFGASCVKTQKNSGPSKIGLSKRALRRFLGVANGNPNHEYFEIWSFHTARGGSSPWPNAISRCVFPPLPRVQ